MKEDQPVAECLRARVGGGSLFSPFPSSGRVLSRLTNVRRAARSKMAGLPVLQVTPGMPASGSISGTAGGAIEVVLEMLLKGMT